MSHVDESNLISDQFINRFIEQLSRESVSHDRNECLGAAASLQTLKSDFGFGFVSEL